jgi:hypothetical protein
MRTACAARNRSREHAITSWLVAALVALITTLLLTRPVLASGVLDGDKKTMVRGIAPLVDAASHPATPRHPRSGISGTSCNHRNFNHLTSPAVVNFVGNFQRQERLAVALTKKPQASATIQGHATFHSVHYMTARDDILELEEAGFLERGKSVKRPRREFLATEKLKNLLAHGLLD